VRESIGNKKLTFPLKQEDILDFDRVSVVKKVLRKLILSIMDHEADRGISEKNLFDKSNVIHHLTMTNYPKSTIINILVRDDQWMQDHMEVVH
jgi:hypothetical protein